MLEDNARLHWENDRLRGALEDLLTTWEKAEGNRGCYSCVPQHDIRCNAATGKEECVCYREDLEGAAKRARNALAGFP